MPETEELELTEREEAIARGEDPDQVDTTLEDEPGEDGVSRGDSGKEEAGKPEAGTDAGTAETTVLPDGQEEKSWITDEIRDTAANYELSDEDLESLGSEAAFKAATAAIERRAKSSEKIAKEGEEEGKDADSEGDKDADSEGDKGKEGGELELLDVEKFREAGFDEDSLKLVESHNKAIERARKVETELAEVRDFVSQQRQIMQEQSLQAARNEFHDEVDRLEEGLFGRSLDDKGEPVQLGKDNDENRRKLFEAVAIEAAGIEKRALDAGKEPKIPTMRELVKRALAKEFGDELQKRSEQDRKQKQLRQSGRRRGAGSRKPGTAVERKPDSADSDPISELINDPDISRAWDDLQEENGTD